MYGASIDRSLSSVSAGDIPSGASFEDLLHRLDENRRAGIEQRRFLLHLNPDDSARM